MDREMMRVSDTYKKGRVLIRLCRNGVAYYHLAYQEPVFSARYHSLASMVLEMGRLRSF